MSGANYFPPATTMGATAPLHPAAPPMSQLAAAMMGRAPNFALPNPAGGLQMPMMNMLMSQQRQAQQNGDPSLMRQGMNGVGNLLSGYQWNGTPGQGGMDALSQQAATNGAAMPVLPQTDPYGSMGGMGGLGGGGVY